MSCRQSWPWNPRPQLARLMLMRLGGAEAPDQQPGTLDLPIETPQIDRLTRCMTALPGGAKADQAVELIRHEGDVPRAAPGRIELPHFRQAQVPVHSV